MDSSYNETVRQSEPPDFDELVQLHYAPLFRFAMTLTRAESAAADLVQETFLAWAEKGRSLRDARAAKSWLFTTLNRAFLQSQRRLTRFPQLAIEEVEAELPSLQAEWVQSMDVDKVLELMGRLEPEFRSALALFYLEDHSYQEIAAITEVPLGTVKSRIARALRQLRDLLQHEVGRGGAR